MTKKLSINRFQYSAGIILLIMAFSLGIWVRAYGEQVGSSPESGSTSYISSLSTSLLSSGYGSDSASPDWGASWNRIKTSAQWVPNGTVTAADVMSGKKFYNSSRTEQTGTLLVAGSSCPTQEYDDRYGAPVTPTTNCVNNSDWTVPSDGIVGTEKLDTRSGLIWSNLIFNDAGTPTFRPSNNSNWSWDASGTANVAVGNLSAIALCTSMGDGWRLPTQKELMQAYIDGAYFNLTQPSNWLWSATTNSSTSKWVVQLSDGYTSGAYYQNNSQVRCVR